MPIRPENAARYPKDWKTAVVPRIRARSGNRCECTGQCGRIHSLPSNFMPDPHGFINAGGGPRCPRRNGEIGYWDDGRFQPHRPLFDGGKSIIKIVLTVMHLDHTPENCADDNLLHACQGCHNRYDAPVRAAGIKARRHAQRASGDLFKCEA